MSHQKKLRHRQQRFIDEYLIDLNGRQAAIRAGYSPHTAREQASRLLTNVNIQAELTAAQVARAQRVQLSQDAVLHELALLAQSDITHYIIDDAGNVQVRDSAPAHAMRAIASLKKKIIHTDTTTIYETELKLWNKPASLRMAGAHLGLFKDAEQVMPDVHVHIHSARERLLDRVKHLAQRHAEDARNGA